jgi:hypothetical protein
MQAIVHTHPATDVTETDSSLFHRSQWFEDLGDRTFGLIENLLHLELVHVGSHTHVVLHRILPQPESGVLGKGLYWRT